MTIVAVNGRYLTAPVTGVQRWPREVVARLPAALDARVLLVVPPDRILDAADPHAQAVAEDARFRGGRGYLWEQRDLPRIVRRIGADLLLSPAAWGPLRVRRQVVVNHDIGPLLHPQYYLRSYVLWNRVVLRPLLRRVARVAVVSDRVRGELVEHLGLPRDRIDVVPPGIAPPFSTIALEPSRTSSYCVFVNGQDTRKNLDFLLGFWPDVHRELGLELHVTQRSGPTPRRLGELAGGGGVVVHVDPDDAELASLYAGALCLLWPSHYEGYGMPLLEAMAAGTPFLSTDTGAAQELAVDPDQVLPLEPERWIAQLRRWRDVGVADLRARSAETARAATWERSAEAMAATVRRALS